MTSYQSCEGDEEDEDISAAIMNNFGSNQVSERSSVKLKENPAIILDCEQNDDDESDNMSQAFRDAFGSNGSESVKEAPPKLQPQYANIKPPEETKSSKNTKPSD